MKNFILSVIIFISYNSFAQYTAIPDVKFEQVLINSGLDSGKTDGKILTENIKDVTYLGVSGSKIKNLKGIEDFTSLKTLDCSNNELVNLNISNNKLLRVLDCKNNKLNFIDISENKNLIKFNVEGNKMNNYGYNQNELSKDANKTSMISSFK